MEKLITYRLAIESDIESINAFYNRIYNKHRNREQFNWEFNSAPAGKAIYIIALHGLKLVGTQCAIPYFIVDENNQITLTAKSEDTLVDPTYRGQNIFENMYSLLIEECKKMAIKSIWGFTYAQKPFKKLKFDIPYRSNMGILVLNTFKAYSYYSKLSATNSFLRKLKILGLCIKSKINFISLSLKGRNILSFTTEKIPLNSSEFNYLEKSACFGLLLDKNFLNYRLYNNPYSKNNHQCSIVEDGKVKASLFYTINSGVAYILHLYFDIALPQNIKSDFIYSVIKKTEINQCNTIRFWGFEHNKINEKETEILKELNFTFIDNGISFVGLKLNESTVNWNNFVVSRLASQGTD